MTHRGLFILLLSSTGLLLARDKFEKRYRDIQTRHERGYYHKSTKVADKIVRTEAQRSVADPSHLIYAYSNKALDRYKLSDFETYETSVGKAVDLFAQIPKDSLRALIFAGRELAEVFLVLGNYQKALEYSEKAYQATLGLDPNNVHIRRAGNTYLKALIKNGFLNKAQQVFEVQQVSYDKFIAEQQLVLNRRGERVVSIVSGTERETRQGLYVEFHLIKAQLLTQRGENAQSIQFLFDNIDVFANKEQFVQACKELGDALYGVGEYQKAEDYYQRATKASKISDHSDFEIYCRGQLNKTYVLLDQNKAYKKNNRKLNRGSKYFPDDNVMRLMPEYNSVMRYLNQERFAKAADAYEDLKENIANSKIYPSDHFWLGMRELQNLIFQKNYQTKALIDSTLSLYRAYEKIYSKDAPELHFKKMGLAQIYTNFSNEFSKSATIFEESFNKYIVNEYSSAHPQYHTFLSTKGDYFDLNERYDSASFYYNAAAQSANECYGDYSGNYILELEKCANMYLKIGDYKQAKAEAELARSMVGKAEGNQKTASIETYQTLGRIYQALGMYGDAKSAFKKAYNQSAKLKYEKEVSVARSADEKSKILMETGNYEDAERLLLNSYQTKKELFGDDSKELVSTYNQLGSLYLVTGKYGDAEKNLFASSEITEKVFGKTSLKYAEILLLLTKLNVALGDMDKALGYAQEALNITTLKLGKKHLKLAEILNEIAMLKYYKGDSEAEVERDLSQAMEINKMILDEGHPKYAENLNALALLKMHQEKYEEATKLLGQAHKIWNDKLGKNNVNVAHIELLQGDLAKYKKDYETAEEHYTVAKQIYGKLFSVNHPNYVRALSRLGQIYFAEGKYEKSLKILEKTTSQYLDFTQKYFGSLSFNQKAKFWDMIKGDFEFYNSLATKVLSTQPDITGNMYDHVIQTKHILMGSTSKVLKSVFESTNEDVRKTYRALIAKRINLTNHLVNGSEDEGFDLKKLEDEIEDLEKKLSEASVEFRLEGGHGKEQLASSWKAIQQKLKPNEYAVEILRYRDFKDDFTDSVIYAALVIAPNGMPPKYVKLKNGNKLEKRYLNYYRNAFKLASDDKYSYQVFWADIKAILPDGATIYLSPEGVFDQINVETLLNTQKNAYVIDENNIVLMTNTKDLLEEDFVGHSQQKTAILCGNPEFYPVSKTEGHIPQLKGAEHEVAVIGEILKAKGWNTHIILYTGADRDSLFPETAPSVFHIATHGYFKQDIESRASLDNDAIVQNPLLRSGILLKGAGDALENNDKKSIGGIFTAYEAMDMNFNNTELIVLSACETALGDVQVGEGVQGLQMGLFISGARNLIMSLFKVPDDVTDQFMTLFYEKWTQSNQLQQSFRSAVQEIRKEHPRPRDWGAFILMTR